MPTDTTDPKVPCVELFCFARCARIPSKCSSLTQFKRVWALSARGVEPTLKHGDFSIIALYLFIYLLFVFIFLQEYFFFICVVTKSRLNPKGSAFEWGVKTPLGEIQYRYSIEVLPNVLNSKPTSKAARAAGSTDTTHQLFTDCQR